MRPDQSMARGCYLTSLEIARQNSGAPRPDQICTVQVDPLDARYEQRMYKPQPAEVTWPVSLDSEDSEKVTFVGQCKDQEMVEPFLQQNTDVFAWSTADMPGIDPEVITHSLNVLPSAKPVKQKKSKLICTWSDRVQAVREEVARLKAAGFIREVLYPEWELNLSWLSSSAWLRDEPRIRTFRYYPVLCLLPFPLFKWVELFLRQKVRADRSSI